MAKNRKANPVGHRKHLSAWLDPEVRADDRDVETRERLIAAAIELAERDGPASIGLREVARRAGVTHAAPYRHFPDREALLVAVADQGFHELLRYVMIGGVDDRDPLERFWGLGISYFTFAVSRPGLFRVMFSPEAARASTLRASEGAVFSLCVTAISGCQRLGKIASGDAQLMALVAWSAMHGAAMLYLDGLVRWIGIDLPAEAIARELTTQVFRGMAKRTR